MLRALLAALGEVGGCLLFAVAGLVAFSLVLLVGSALAGLGLIPFVAACIVGLVLLTVFANWYELG
jgi:hypothetical protein